MKFNLAFFSAVAALFLLASPAVARHGGDDDGDRGRDGDRDGDVSSY